MKKDIKENKNLIIIIVVLILVILVLVGYIIYSKNITKNNNINPPIENTTTDIKDSKEEKELNVDEQIRTDEIATKLSNEFAAYYPITDTSLINNQDLLRLASSELFDFNNMQPFTKAQVEATIKKYFGNSVAVKHESIECFTDEKEPLYIYDGNIAYSYNTNHAGHGGVGGKKAFVIYESGTRKGNTIKANYKIAYTNYLGDIGIIEEIYARYNDTTPIYTIEDPENTNITIDLINNYKDMLPTTTFTFEVSNSDVYDLKSVEIN